MEVDIVQGRDALEGAVTLAQQFQGAVGEHLVDVDVGAGARASLQGVDHHVNSEVAGLI
jgi:hypothetical protein